MTSHAPSSISRRENGDTMSAEDERHAAAVAIADALYRWRHDCNGIGHGVIQCGACQMELNGFGHRNGDGLAEDVRLTLSQKGYVLATVGSIVEAAQERADLLGTIHALRGAIYEAHALLTPGMKAGVGEARQILQAGLDHLTPQKAGA